MSDPIMHVIKNPDWYIHSIEELEEKSGLKWDDFDDITDFIYNTFKKLKADVLEALEAMKIKDDETDEEYKKRVNEASYNLNIYEMYHDIVFNRWEYY